MFKTFKTREAPLSLTFKAVVQDGEGRHSRMVFPGRETIKGAPEDWPGPERMARGSLNCGITAYPDDFAALAGDGDRIQRLDNGRFKPEFTIPAKAIENNCVQPFRGGDRRRGLAQVWRCAVTNEDTGETFDAWHVRRVDDTYPPFHGVIELMADRKLRDAHQLQNGTPLTITMYSK